MGEFYHLRPHGPCCLFIDRRGARVSRFGVHILVERLSHGSTARERVDTSNVQADIELRMKAAVGSDGLPPYKLTSSLCGVQTGRFVRVQPAGRARR